MCLKMSDIISFIKLDKSRCISLLLCFWHINCLILMVIYPNNYSNFRTIMEVIMKNKWLLCILLMLFLPFGLFAQVAPPLEKQKTETQEAPENNNEVTTNSDTTTDGDAGKTIKGVINDEQERQSLVLPSLSKVKIPELPVIWMVGLLSKLRKERF